jgi:hypothetical protein
VGQPGVPRILFAIVINCAPSRPTDLTQIHLCWVGKVWARVCLGVEL